MTQTVLTAEGFKKMRYEDFLAETETKIQELFGADVNLDPKGPMGKLAQLFAYSRAEDNELAEAIYYSGNAETAEGVALDYAVKRNGLTRNQAKPSTATVTLTVTPGKLVSAGMIVSTVAGIDFTTTADVTDSDNNGSLDAPVTAVLAGSGGNVPAGAITVIKTAIVGVTAVTNAAAATGGQDAENDVQLRARYKDTQASGGKATVDAIRAEILSTVEGVRGAYVIENDTSAIDSGGRPPNSFEAVVLGGVAADIGAAILRSKAGGIRAYGAQTVTLNDSSGNPKTVGFTPATAAQIFVNVTLTTNSKFPVNGSDLVKSQVISYIGGYDDAGLLYTGLGLGQTVILTKIMSAILGNVEGVDDVAVTMKKGAGGTFAAANIAMLTTEVPEVTGDRVVITIA
jgi:uncharacterized phage protein gp47/JayE